MGVDTGVETRHRPIYQTNAGIFEVNPQMSDNMGYFSL
jgi:hypothetical protein